MYESHDKPFISILSVAFFMKIMLCQQYHILYNEFRCSYWYRQILPYPESKRYSENYYRYKKWDEPNHSSHFKDY